MIRSFAYIISVAIFLILTATGCTRVHPWEREYLADEIMLTDSDPLNSEWHLHIQEVLEGGRGGYNGSGGGCGCR